MHHDSRTYIEFRYDGNSTDVVVVNFRDRGILPTETVTWEYTFDSPVLQASAHEELGSLLNKMWLAWYGDK